MSRPPQAEGVPETATDGILSVGPFRLPLSAALSSASRAQWAAILSSPQRIELVDPKNFSIETEFATAVDAFRHTLDEGIMRPASERLLADFPVNIASNTIGGVPVEVFTPRDGLDAERVLINLHGGAFYAGATYVARVESIPMTHKGGFRVVSVNYRQGYEHKFPAASEDVAAVYTELLKDYPADRIGIYGASAGGMLAAQATAWILEHDLPAPGAIGILSAGTGGSGDGAFFSAIGTGKSPPDDPIASITQASVGYFAHTRTDDYLVNPNVAPLAFRSKFPPTLIITATRAFDLSPALATHRALCQAGVETSLHVFDGLGHSFFYDAVTPEAVDAYETIIRFFRKHLAHQI